MLATQISNLYNAPSIVRKLLGFKLKSDDDKLCEKAVKALVKKITKSEMLNELEKALITQDAHSQCVTITRSQDGRVQVSQRKNFPHQLYCNIWRWPDLQNLNELKSVDHCLFPFNSKKDVVCINPYHYVRVGGVYPKISNLCLSLSIISTFWASWEFLLWGLVSSDKEIFKTITRGCLM